MIDQNSSKKGYQQLLEDDILGLNEDIFQQIGIKSLTRHESFLTLAKGRKRQIIENIFGIEILSEMRDLNKSRINEIDNEIDDIDKKIENKDILISQEYRNIEKLRSIQNELKRNFELENQTKQKEIDDLQSDINKLLQASLMIDDYEKKFKELNKTYLEQKTEIESLNNLIQKINLSLKITEGNICFVKDKCPSCPNLDKMENEQDEGLKKERNQMLETKAKIEAENNAVFEEKNRLEETFLQKRSIIREKINHKENQIKKIKNSMETKKETNVEIDDSTLLRYEQEKEELKKQKEKIKERLTYHKVVFGILKDDGIKAYVIRKYLPILNKLMNTYLQRFHIDLEMEFTPNMDIEIKTKFKEGYSFGSFSEGEKKRINLALTFTFLEFCKLKYSNSSINVLVLDEFFEGLDAEGEYYLYGILKDMVKKESKEIITITPEKTDDFEKIDKLYHASIERGFSQLKLINNV